jgi:hypothetical protein
VSTLDDAWQGGLAAEERAVFGYGVLGPHLSGADRPLAFSCVDDHEALRDATAADLAGAGRTPVPALSDYPDLYPVIDAVAARRLAVRLEEGCADAWRYLYLQAASRTSAQAAALRRSAQQALTASAVRATRWRALVDPRHAATPFPGL